MFYRALHVISSQRYRLPVRRYILDLFNIDLDEEVVKRLSEHASNLKLKTGVGDATTRVSRAMSIVGRPAKNRRISESDEESMSEDDGATEITNRPVLNLRPQSRIIGFE